MNIYHQTEFELWIHIEGQDVYYATKKNLNKSSRDFIDYHCSEDGITPSEWQFKEFDSNTNCDIYKRTNCRSKVKCFLDILKDGKKLKLVHIKNSSELLIDYNNGLFNVVGGDSCVNIKEMFFVKFMEWYCSGKYTIKVMQN